MVIYSHIRRWIGCNLVAAFHRCLNWWATLNWQTCKRFVNLPVTIGLKIGVQSKSIWSWCSAAVRLGNVEYMIRLIITASMGNYRCAFMSPLLSIRSLLNLKPAGNAHTRFNENPSNPAIRSVYRQQFAPRKTNHRHIYYTVKGYDAPTPLAAIRFANAGGTSVNCLGTSVGWPCRRWYLSPLNCLYWFEQPSRGHGCNFLTDEVEVGGAIGISWRKDAIAVVKWTLLTWRWYYKKIISSSGMTNVGDNCTCRPLMLWSWRQHIRNRTSSWY